MKFVTHQITLHLSSKIKCCVDQLRPPLRNRHHLVTTACPNNAMSGSERIHSITSSARASIGTPNISACERVRSISLSARRIPTICTGWICCGYPSDNSPGQCCYLCRNRSGLATSALRAEDARNPMGSRRQCQKNEPRCTAPCFTSKSRRSLILNAGRRRGAGRSHDYFLLCNQCIDWLPILTRWLTYKCLRPAEK
jgi:hypothetical protein